MEKINPTKIFFDHIRTLRLYDQQRVSYRDIFFFYGLPIIAGLAVARYTGVDFIVSNSTELITFYSVFGGFMLNLLALIYGFNLSNFKNTSLATEVLKETTSNISYLIAVASLMIFSLFVMRLVSEVQIDGWLSFGLVVFFVSSFINFALTILMVLKRFYSLNANRV